MKVRQYRLSVLSEAQTKASSFSSFHQAGKENATTTTTKAIFSHEEKEQPTNETEGTLKTQTSIQRHIHSNIVSLCEDNGIRQVGGNADLERESGARERASEREREKKDREKDRERERGRDRER